MAERTGVPPHYEPVGRWRTVNSRSSGAHAAAIRGPCLLLQPLLGVDLDTPLA